MNTTRELAMDMQMDFYQAELAYRRERLLAWQGPRRTKAARAARRRVLERAAEIASRRTAAEIPATEAEELVRQA